MRHVLILAVVLAASLAVGQNNPHAPLSQQKVCAEEAQKAFNKSFKAEQDGVSFEFTSHYDTQAKVCYVLVHGSGATSKSTPYVSYSLFDAIEGRTYGDYLWINSTQKKYWEVAPISCSVKPRGSDKVLCHSDDEFDELIDKYFGIGR
jgi:triacylglycerol esterase/lipase EstA (alpha/beta hydrolase family)